MPRFVAPLNHNASGSLRDSSATSTATSRTTSQSRLRPPVHPSLREPGDTWRDSTESVPNVSATTPDPDRASPADEGEELSEEQLRAIYDNEEIDRFLNLFSAYVSEVRIQESVTGGEDQTSTVPTISEAGPEQIRSGIPGVDYDSSSSEEWVSVASGTPTDAPPPLPPRLSQDDQDVSLSRRIALKYIIPSLSPQRPSRPTFTIGRFRLATQRLYLAVAPQYERFFLKLWYLATWRQYHTSLKYCILFWVLWYYNFLLPSLFLRVGYAVVRRKLFAYPTLSELRQRRREVGRARAFAKEVETRLAAPPTIAMNELWRFLKLAAVTRLTAYKTKKSFDAGGDTLSPEQDVKEIQVEPEQTTTVLEKESEEEEVEDIKSTVIFIMDQVSDTHERIRNLFLWRRPQASWLFILVLAALFLVTACVPAKYLAKGAYAACGMAFWHVTPILAAMTASERARMPPPLCSLPTDADYAMDLISHRVALGLDVRPPHKRKGSGNPPAPSPGLSEQPGDRNNNMKWKKWGERVAAGKAWIEGSRRLVNGQQWSQSGSWPPPGPLLPSLAFVYSTPDAQIETHTFPAQHAKAPGLITLTNTTLFFTPLMSSTAKVVIALSDICAVKKVGPMKGLHVRWMDSVNERHARAEREEIFRWVGGRDELFARLVGWQGRRWVRI